MDTKACARELGCGTEFEDDTRACGLGMDWDGITAADMRACVRRLG